MIKQAKIVFRKSDGLILGVFTNQKHLDKATMMLRKLKIEYTISFESLNELTG